jgi:hypothetical protein
MLNSKQAEEALLVSQVRLAGNVNSAAGAIITLDLAPVE